MAGNSQSQALYVGYLPLKKQLEKKIKSKDAGIDKIVTKVNVAWKNYKKAFDEELMTKVESLSEDELR